MNIRQEALGAAIAIGAEALPRVIHGVADTAADIEKAVAEFRLPKGAVDLRPKSVPSTDPWTDVYKGEAIGRFGDPAYYVQPKDNLPTISLDGGVIRTEYAVIGGGHAGLPAAFKLAEEGHDVALLTAGPMGDPQIPSSYAMMVTRYPDLDFLPVDAAHGPAFFGNFYPALKQAHLSVMERVGRHGNAVDFSRLTSHKIDYAEDSSVKDEFALLAGQGDRDFRLLHGADAEKIFPGATWALAIDNEGGFSGYKELRAYAAEARFPIFQNTYVVGIRPKEAGRPLELFTADGGRVIADNVYIAAGRPVGGMEDSRRFMVPLQAHATRSLIPSDRIVSGNNFDNGASFNYFRPTPEDRRPVPAGMKSMFLGGDARFLLDGGQLTPQSEHMPDVARDMFGGYATHHGQNMVFGTVIDGSPVIVPHPQLDGVMAVIGTGGNGAVSGEMAAEDYRRFMLEGKPLLLSASRFDRVPLSVRQDAALGPYRAQF